MLEESHYYFRKAADILGLPTKVKEILLTPHRAVKVDVVTEGEDGRLEHHLGFRVQHNNARGTYKGGLRYHPTVDEDHSMALTNLMTWTTEHHTVNAFPGGDSFPNVDVLTWDADVLIPAAMEDVINKGNADAIRAQIIVEAANGPTTPEADEILHSNGVLVVPDILANAGGVTVSYFEWAQNIQQFQWERDKIVGELERKIRRAYGAVRDTAREKKLDLRAAAFVLAITRVGRAALARRHVREDLILSSEP